MKHSLSLLALLLAPLALACGTDESGTSVPAHPTDQTPATQPTATPTKRTLVTGNQLPTSPTNLLADPGFQVVGGQGLSFGVFVALSETDFSQVDLSSTLDSRSPAGQGGGVGLIMPTGATDSSSDSVMTLCAISGGDGPFHAQAWVSKSHVDGRAMDFDIDPKQLKISIFDSDPDGTGYDLAVVPESTRKVGDRTWMLLELALDKPLTHGAFFVIHTGDKGGQWHIAAPEVTAQPLVAALGTQSRRLAPAVRRPLAAVEKKAVVRYVSSIKPRRIPAAPEAKRTKD